MVFDANHLRRHIDTFLVAVKKQYRVERAILFGSYAAGRQREDSDIDLVIISPDFRGMPKLERHQKLGWIAWQAKTDYLEPLGFTPEEYANASHLGLLGEVRDTGVVVYEAEPEPAVREPSPAYVAKRNTQKMKVVIPLAGYGTRLRPHTFTKPKPLINVAGKPVLGHVLDMFKNVSVDEFIFITGHLGDQIEQYVGKNYPNIKARYFEQKELNGQSTAVYLAKDHLSGPMLIVFVDTIVETDLSALADETADAVAWVKPTEDPRRFGVALVGTDGYVTKLIEKPEDKNNNLVVVGFYYLKDSQAFMRAIEEQIAKSIKTKNEYFLADALQLLLDKGMKMRVQPVEVWEDCGKPETVLHTNRYLLDHGHDNSAQINADDYIIIPPVNIHPTAKITHSIIGPHATIAANCRVENSIIRDSIIDEGASIQDATLAQSLIGREARVTAKFRAFNVGDSSEVGFE